MAIELTGLKDEVAAVVQEEQAAVTLINGIAQRIADAVAAIPNVDPAVQAEVDDLTAKLKASSEALAAAVIANTPTANTTT